MLKSPSGSNRRNAICAVRGELNILEMLDYEWSLDSTMVDVHFRMGFKEWRTWTSKPVREPLDPSSNWTNL